jgi:hypothetical protein
MSKGRDPLSSRPYDQYLEHDDDSREAVTHAIVRKDSSYEQTGKGSTVSSHWLNRQQPSKQKQVTSDM